MSLLGGSPFRGSCHQLRKVRWCREKLKDMYTGFCKDYPIVTIEDPFDQDDWDATAAFTAEGVCQV